MNEDEKKQLIKILQKLYDICEDLSYERTVAAQLAFAKIDIKNLQRMFRGTND